MFPATLPRPLRLALYAGAVCVLLWLTLAPSDDLPAVTFWDKAEHSLAWLVLTGLGLALSPRRPRAIILFALALGAGIEVAQSIMDLGRQGDWRDFVSDSVGVAAAFGLYLASGRMRGDR